jgi:hypothetical protein
MESGVHMERMWVESASGVVALAQTGGTGDVRPGWGRHGGVAARPAEGRGPTVGQGWDS